MYVWVCVCVNEWIEILSSRLESWLSPFPNIKKRISKKLIKLKGKIILFDNTIKEKESFALILKGKGREKKLRLWTQVESNLSDKIGNKKANIWLSITLN